MTASIWTAYAERRPTKEDADGEGRIYIRSQIGTYSHVTFGLDRGTEE